MQIISAIISSQSSLTLPRHILGAGILRRQTEAIRIASDVCGKNGGKVFGVSDFLRAEKKMGEKNHS